MTRKFLLLFVFALASFAGSRAVVAFEIEEIRTPGGITVWFVEEHSIPLISVEVVFRGGSVRDPVGKEGLAYFTSTLLDEGAGELDADAFQKRMLEKAIKLGFGASTDKFSVSLHTLSGNREDAFELLRLALSEPRFDPEAVERLRGQILMSLKREKTNPSNIVSDAWYEAMFPDHVYSRRRRGTEATIGAISENDLRHYTQQQFATEQMIVGVVGDVTPAEIARLIDETFGVLPTAADFLADDIEPPTFGDARFQVIEHSIPQTRILFGNSGILRDDPDFYAAYVLNYIVGGSGLSSRLADEVREKRGLAYSVGTSLAAFNAAGYLFGSTGTANERVLETVEVIQAELGEIVAGNITESEIQAAKAYLTGSFGLNFDSNAKLADALVQFQYDDRGIDYFDRRNGIINAVTLDQLKAVAQRFIKPDEMIWMLIGQPVGVEHLISAESE